MLVHILISVLLGVLSYWIASLLHARHDVAVIIGIIVGLLALFGAVSL